MNSITENHKQALQEIIFIYSNKHLIRLKKLLLSIPGYLENIMEILLKKSFIKKDPYNYPEDDNVFKLPKETALQDRHEDVVIYNRLKTLKQAYMFQAEHLSTPDEITEPFLEKTRQLLENINFSNLSYNSTNTKIYNELLGKVYDACESKITDILTLNQNLLKETHKQIQILLEDITKFQKKIYKFKVNLELFHQLPHNEFNEQLFMSNNDLYIEKLEQYIAKHSINFPIVKYYIKEAISECYTENIDILIEDFKNTHLSGRNAKKVMLTPRAFLLMTLRISGKLTRPFKSIQQVLSENYTLYLRSKKTFTQTLLHFVKKVAGIPIKLDPIPIQYFDPDLEKFVTNKVYFESFLADIKKVQVIYEQVSLPNSPLSKKLNEAPLTNVKKYLSNIFRDSFLLKEQSTGFENEFITVLKNKMVGQEVFEKGKKEIEVTLLAIFEKQKEYMKMYRK